MKRMDKIEKEIKLSLESITKNKLIYGSNRSKTMIVKNMFRKLGKKYGFLICGHNKEYSEYLYDVTWMKYDSNDYLKEIPLILECEWMDNDEEINNDFEKLLIGKAKHRVMIFWKNSNEKINEKMDKFELMIKKFKDTEPGDRFMFAGLNWNTGNIEFRLYVHK